jgi:hypothetical protein
MFSCVSASNVKNSFCLPLNKSRFVRFSECHKLSASCWLYSILKLTKILILGQLFILVFLLQAEKHKKLTFTPRKVDIFVFTYTYVPCNLFMAHIVVHDQRDTDIDYMVISLFIVSLLLHRTQICKYEI